MRLRPEPGSIVRAIDESRSAWPSRWIADLAADVRYGFRTLRRSPGFAVTAILSLALGIGANAAIVNALYSVLWKPLPISKPEELVRIALSSDAGLTDAPTVAFIHQLRTARVFEDITATSMDGLTFAYDDRAERVQAEFVTGNYFDVLGVRAAIGQPFTPQVRRGQWAPEAVLSYGFWQRRFGGDPGVIGRTIRLNTYPFTIAGVSPLGFHGLERGTNIEIRIPILPAGAELQQIARISARLDRGLFTIARLKHGSRVAQAEVSADVQLQQYLRTTVVQRFRDRSIRHVRLAPLGTGGGGTLRQFQTPLYVLLVLMALVLLIACANVASMLLARAAVRTRELAVRTSVGAGRSRLIRQMLAESLLLALFAGGLAVVIANWVARALVYFVPQGNFTTVLDLRMDVVTVFVVPALSLAACVAFGVAPAVTTTRCNLAASLKADSGSSTGDVSRGWFRKLLVASQVAFSLVLLIAAGIFLRTMLNLWPGDYGAHPERVLLFTIKPQMEIYTAVQRRALVAEVVRRVSEVPGVAAAGVAEYGPLGNRVSEDRASIDAGSRQPIRAETDWVSAGFFEAVGIPHIAGRDFATSDTVGSAPVAILNQSLAHALFGNTSPLGRTIRLMEGRSARAFEIVGVVADARYYDIHGAAQPAVWFTFQDAAPYMPTLHVRSSGVDTEAMAAAIRRELDALDKGFPVFNVKSFETRIAESLGRERILATLSGAVGYLALALAAVGLYGILAYSVSRRTREVGIRMALGSSAGSVLWMVAREALLLLGVGSLGGIALSLAGWRLLSARMPDVAPIDVEVLMACTAIMLTLAAAAVSIPAIRACRIDPLIALRHE